MSEAKEVGILVPEFYLSDNSKLFVMRRFDQDEQLNSIGFGDMAALMGLPAGQKYSKSYLAFTRRSAFSAHLTKYSNHWHSYSLS